MAAADIVKGSWGYSVGGTGTDATTVTTDTIIVKAMAFAGNADNATCTITAKDNGGLDKSCIKFKTNGFDLDASGQYVYFGEDGIRLESPIVTLSNASDMLYIYLK